MEGRSDELDDQIDNRVIVWSLPRTISTVLTKCHVHLEPYGYAHAHPVTYEGNGALLVQAAQIMEAFTKSKVDPKRLPFTRVQSELETSTGKHAFVKDRSHATKPQFRQFPSELGFRHVFLIQEPSIIFASYRKAMYKQVTELKMLEKSEEEYDIVEDDVVGMLPLNLYKNHHDLWKYVQENFDPTPLVLDAIILSNPSHHLKRFLGDLGLYPDFLLHVYGMSPHPFPSREQLTSDVIRCVDAAMPYYQEMYKDRFFKP